MTERTVSVRLRMMISEYEAMAAQAGLTTKTLGSTITGLNHKSELSFKKLGMEAVNAGKAMASGGQMSGMGTAAIAAGALVAGAAILKLTKEGVANYMRLAGEVRQYSRVSGASAEDSSRMVAAAHVLGVETSTLASGMFRLAVRIDTNKAALQAHGVEIARTKTGQVDLQGTLLNLADRYGKTADAQQRATLVMSSFGRGGMALMPILAAGRERLEEFWRAAERHGEILSQDDLNKARDMRIATAEMHNAWEGFTIQLGRGAVPILTEVAHWLERIIELGADLSHGFKVPDVPVVSSVAKSKKSEVDGLGKAFDKMWTAFRAKPGDWDTFWTGTDKAAESAKALADAEQETTDNIKEAAKAVEQYVKDVDAYVATIGGASIAQDGWQQGLVDLATHLKEAKKEYGAAGVSLDRYTALGLENRKALDGQLKLAGEWVKSLAQQGMGHREMQANLDNMATSLESTAESLGLSKTEAKKYGDEIRAIPTEVSTTIKLDTADAEHQLAGIVAQLRTIDPFLAQDLGRQAAHNADLTGGDLADIGRAAITRANTAARAPAKSGPDKASEIKARADEAKRKADEAKRAAEQAVKDRRAMQEDEYQSGLISATRYIQLLDKEITAAKGNAKDIADLQHKKTDVLKTEADKQARVEDIQYERGNLSADAYKGLLKKRITALAGHADEQQSIWQKIDQIEDDELKKTMERSQRLQDGIDAAIKSRDTEFANLNDLLDQEKKIRKQMDDLAKDHRQRLLDQERSYNEDYKHILTDRASALMGWANITERASIQWGNSIQSLTSNTKDQVASFQEWTDALDTAQRRGVSDAVISLLGLDEGPQALGQLRMFASATNQEIAELNDAVARRQQLANDRAVRDAATMTGQVGKLLRDLATKNAAAIEAENEKFLRDQKDLADELAKVGEDTGRRFGDAIALGLASSIPAIQEAARRAAEAMALVGRLPTSVGGIIGTPDSGGTIHIPGGPDIQIRQPVPGYQDIQVPMPTSGEGMFDWGPGGPPSWMPDLFGGISGLIPKYAEGTARVPKTGLSITHVGERIFSAPDNQALISAIQMMGTSSPVIEVYIDGVKTAVRMEQRATGVRRVIVGAS